MRQFLFALLMLPAVAAAQEPKTILLVAGPADSNHPRGTHEYEATARLLKYALETSPNLRGVRPVVVTGGWPTDPSLLDSAASIVLITSGADRNAADHPLLAGDRLAVLEKQMRRGCGLVAIHWTVFVPNAGAGDKFLDWLGGHFDYQSGPPPRRWTGAIQDANFLVTPGGSHPILRGVEPFRLREEFYYQIRFRPNDPRLTPILKTEVPKAGEQTVAWAVERADGGRGFGFTGGHYYDNWRVPGLRKSVLNAIAWTAKLDVPSGGVESILPDGGLDVPAGDPAWTPRPGTGNVAAWEMAGDKDWQDGRLRVMDTGPSFNATYLLAGMSGSQHIYKGTALKVGDGGVLFDRSQCRLAAAWTGGWVKHSDKRFGFLNTPTPLGSIAIATASGPGWAGPNGEWAAPTPATTSLPKDWARYRGMYNHGAQTVLSYTVGGADVLESFDREEGAIARTLEVGPSKKPLTMLVGQLPAGGMMNAAVESLPVIATQDRAGWSAVALVGTDKAELKLAPGNRGTLTIPPGDGVRRFKLLLWHGADFASFMKQAKASQPTADLTALTKPGPKRWAEPLVTRGEIGPDAGPLTIDTLTVPYDNPLRALFFITGVDTLPNGDLAVCTAHGDVWIVSGVDAKLERLTWRRFATGLYQPMGLKVADGKIVVLERGQLTRLHDRDGDGEADFCENLNSDWHTGSGEHSYDTCLETDSQGNFHFFKTGDTETPTGGTLLRVSKDGSKLEMYATGFRHPIGLGMGPNDMVTGADQEGNYMPATRIDIYRPGGFYGDMRAHHRQVPPTTYDPPLCWLPRQADNSAGGQVWVPKEKWGPLGGQFVHFSWGRCRMMQLFREQVGGVWQGGAVDLGLFFLSGAKAGCFNPADGHLYVAGLNGWQCAARRDGCLQRVRATGKPFHTPVDWKTTPTGVQLTFGSPLDRASAGDPAKWSVAAWNYRYSHNYGSKNWSVANPNREGMDAWPVEKADVSADGKTVSLTIRGWRPAMQIQVKYALMAADGEPTAGSVFATVHRLPER